MKTIYLDIMLNERFYGQVKFGFSPLFAYNEDSVKKTIEDKFPQLQGNKVRFSNQKIRK
jgi:hypothetical protein